MTHVSYQWCQIPNGPRLAVATLPTSECAAVSIHIPAGSRDEDKLPSGIAHFVEHMVFKGTTTRTAREINLDVENAGGQINACTSEDQTVYEGRGEAELLPTLLNVLADIVWNATFPPQEITLERDVIEEEITMYRESPTDHIGDLISKSLWHTHPLGNPISGTIESIATITQQDLIHFRNLHYFRNDLVIAAAGPFSINEVQAILQPLLPSCFLPPPASLPFHPTLSPLTPIIDHRDTDQVQLALAWHTPGRHSERRHALRLLSMILGESSCSRLFQVLREERGLCYHVSSDVSLFHDTGAFEIHVGLDQESVELARECIFTEINDLIQNGPTLDELERAKRLSIAQSKLSFEPTSAHSTWAGEGVLDFGYIPSADDWRSHVRSVTPTDIQTAAQLVFDQRPFACAEIRP